MNKTNKSKHSAQASLIGYLYQCRLALFEALKRTKTNPNLTVAIETLDDVVFETDGMPSEIVQVKHHVSRQANLTNSSTDLWKTILIWCDLVKSGTVQKSAVFCMMTTQTAPEGTAAYYLRPEGKNIESAETLLMQTAQTSVNQSNKNAYKSFLALTPESRRELLEYVVVLDNCPLINDLGQLLQKEIWTACHRSKTEQFLSYLEGWWFQRILKSLTNDQSKLILGEELDSRLDTLREEFKSDALPIHDDLVTATVDHKLYDKYTFVHQLKLIDIKEKRISIAVNNYYRAFEQRSRWIREDLIIIGDIDDYEKKLMEEWEIQFERMCEELGEDVAEQEKVKKAREIYNWVEKDADIPLRPRCKEPFITRGSYHILSDKQKVGWHPEFRDRLKTLFESKGVTQ